MSKEQSNKLFNGLDLKKQRSKFDMSYRNQFSANFGKMIPTMCMDVMPGDHVESSTEFFTRWLTMLAPTFNKIDLKFNQFFVHNSSIWGGWPQFMGEGDDMSSDYLLGHEARNGMKVPYITTRQLAKFLGLNLSQPDKSDVNSSTPLKGFALTPLMQKKYRLCFGYFLSQLSRNPMKVTDSSDSIGDNQRALINAVLWRKPEIVAFPFICRKDDGLVDSLIDLGYCMQCTGDETDAVLSKFLKGCASQRKCMYLPSFNIEWLSSFAKAAGEEDFSTWNFETVSQDIIFPSSRHFTTLKYFASSSATTPTYLSAAKDVASVDLADLDRVSVYYSGFKTTTEVDDVDTVYLDSSKTNERLVSFYDLIGFQSVENPSVGQSKITIDYSKEIEGDVDASGRLNYYYPCGGEKVLPLLRFSAYASHDDKTTKFAGFYLMYFYISEKMLVHMLGSGTLSDYLGLNLTQSVVVNDSLIADGVFHYTQTHQNDLRGKYSQVPWGSEGVVYSRASKSNTFGTYHEQTNTFEMAVINDEPISLLPYLAYKRCWNDLIRDPRFQIHDPYSNKYTSPFLVPLSDGTYHNGECFRVSDGGRLLVDAPGFFEDGYVPSVANIWHKDSFFQFFELRDRRVSHDCFTLITPNNQWGDEVTADGVGDFVRKDGNPIRQSTSGSSGITAGDYGTEQSGLYNEHYSVTGPFDEDKRILPTSSISVNAIRLAGAIQKFMERNNIVGSDFVKQQIAHFGIAPEHRNEVAHYLGGDKFNMNVSPVDMLGGNTDSQTTGQQTAQATCSGKACKFRYDVKEHGYLLQWVTIQNNFSYTTQLKKQFIDKYDYPFVEYANLAPEEVPLKSLVNCDGSVYFGDDYSPLRRYGFAPRYWWAKFNHDEIHGDFKKSLSYWVSTRKISSGLFGGLFGWNKRPIIGADMQYEDPDYKCFTYSGEDYGHCLFDMKHHIYISRNLPMLPNPQID